MTGINVLSLFDGISCGRIALQNAGIKVNNYFSSEIEKNALKVSASHFPDIVQLGDVKNFNSWKLPKIDLLMAGSPCMGFSQSGQGKGFSHPESRLYFNFLDCLDKFQPEYFLLENVPMKKKIWEQQISSDLNTEAEEINSSLVSAQDRRRLYWGNFEISQPKDKKITANEIIGPEPLWLARSLNRKINPLTGKRDDYNKSIKNQRYLECKSNAKAHTLTTINTHNVVVPERFDGRRKAASQDYRFLTPEECEELQTLPEGWTSVVKSQNQRCSMIALGWTVDVIEHIFKNLT